MTDREKEIVKGLNHSLYTVEYLEEWINRNEQPIQRQRIQADP